MFFFFQIWRHQNMQKKSSNSQAKNEKKPNLHVLYYIYDVYLNTNKLWGKSQGRYSWNKSQPKIFARTERTARIESLTSDKKLEKFSCLFSTCKFFPRTFMFQWIFLFVFISWVLMKRKYFILKTAHNHTCVKKKIEKWNTFFFILKFSDSILYSFFSHNLFIYLLIQYKGFVVFFIKKWLNFYFFSKQNANKRFSPAFVYSNDKRAKNLHLHTQTFGFFFCKIKTQIKIVLKLN